MELRRLTPPTRPGRSVSALLGPALLALALAFTPASPAAGHGDGEILAPEERVAAGAHHDTAGAPAAPAAEGVPLRQNLRLVDQEPGQLGISGCFLPTAPLYVTSGLDSLRVLDVSRPRRPEVVGSMTDVVFENEAMTCAERRTPGGTRRFALIGVDLVQAAPAQPQHVNVGGGELVVVEVTDPAAPRILSRTEVSTSTHTVACVRVRDCSYAYTAGSGGEFSVLDLRRIDRPTEVDADPATAGLQAFASPTAGHKWNFDAAGYGTHTGFDGASMWDTSQPRSPRLVTTTGRAGRGTDPRYPGWNDFVLHNSWRPHARRFEPGTPPSPSRGNVLLVTEEDYEETDCSQAGSFQTWWVKRLDGSPSAIVPLDKVELADLGSYPSPRGAFCSSHWFDHRPGGLVAAGFYGGGTQLLDVRDPRRIRAYGHAVELASEVWDAMWVPVYRGGRMTAARTDVVYAVDLLRGLDVYDVRTPAERRRG